MNSPICHDYDPYVTLRAAPSAKRPEHAEATTMRLSMSLPWRWIGGGP